MPLNDFLQVDDSSIDLIVTVTQSDGTTPIDISQASSIFIYLYRPDGGLITGNASFLTDGTDGKIQYITQINDCNIQGIYKIQAKYIIGGATKRTEKSSFVVEPNLIGVN